VQPADAITSPTFLSPGHYVEGANDGAGHEWDVILNDRESTAGRWRVIANLHLPFQGQPIVAGPEANPTLVQPYARTTVTDPTSPFYGQTIVQVVSLSNFSGGGSAHQHWTPPISISPSRHRLGGLGGYDVTGGEYWALGVDPVDPTRMIAPDVIDGAMKTTTDGGDTWGPIPGLDDLITRHGAFKFSVPYANTLAPLATVVSFCPDNDSRVLIATRESGDYFSADGGANWVAVPNTDDIVSATSAFWLRGCAGAYVSSDGRGVWRIDMNVHARLTLCPSACTLTARVNGYLHTHHLPRTTPGLLALDGSITSATTRGHRTNVVVTPGTAISFFPRRNRALTISYTGRFTRHKRYGVAVLALGTRHVLLTSPRPPRLYPLRKGRPGRGLGHPPKAALGSIRIVGVPLTAAGGIAAVHIGGPLVVTGAVSRSIRARLQLRVDGVADASLPRGTRNLKVTVERRVVQALGLHSVSLVSLTRKRPLVLATQSFEVVNADDEDPSPPRQASTIASTCPATATPKVPITIAGRLNPWLQGATVTITYTSPGGSTVVDSAVVQPDGTYSDTDTPTRLGTLTVAASWSGNAEYLPAGASPCQIKVS
jgi:hypothetical protein